MVPLRMPITRVTGSPRRLSRNGRMSGIPPATAASNRRSTPLRIGGREQFGADVGEQFLVAGDDRLAGRQRSRDQFACRLDAADHLDHEIDVGIGDHGQRVAGENALGERDAPVARQVADGDAPDLETESGASFDRLRLALDERHEGGTDVAAAEQTDSNGAGVVRHDPQSNRRSVESDVRIDRRREGHPFDLGSLTS